MPLPLARTKIVQFIYEKMLFKSLGCNASSPKVWISLHMIFDRLTQVTSAAFFLALDLMWCLTVACSSCGHECSFVYEIIVEHAAYVLIQALQGGLDFAHRQEISVCICTHPRLYFFDHGLFLLQKYSSFLLKHI